MRKILLLFCISFSIGLAAQDQHFTQFYASPQTLNPALTGAFSGTYRFSLIYRDQWRKVFDSPFVTYSANIDLRFNTDNRRGGSRDAFGVGMVFFADKNNLIGFSTNQIGISGAYHKSLGSRSSSYLSIGGQAMVAQRNVNYENLSFADQFDGSTGYTFSTNEDLPENNFGFTDYSVGLNYSYEPDGGVGLHLGAALFHVSEPQISFYQEEENPERVGNATLDRKYVAYVNASLPAGEALTFSPRALVYSQGSHLAANAGMNVRFLLDDVNGTALHLGSWARPVRNQEDISLDAIIGMVGIELNSFIVGVSYDVNISDRSNLGPDRSALEVSISYLGNYDNNPIICPKF